MSGPSFAQSVVRGTKENRKKKKTLRTWEREGRESENFSSLGFRAAIPSRGPLPRHARRTKQKRDQS